MRLGKTTTTIRKLGAARFELTDPYHLAVSLPWSVFTIGALALLFLINLVFASLYLVQPDAVQNLPPGDLANALFFSLETLATVGYGEMAPATRYGHSVAAAEIVVGMGFTAILTGLLFVRFSRPKARILFADRMVVAPHNGCRTLMVRVVNGRLTMLTRARAFLGILLESTSAEGVVMRNVEALTLVRDELAVFPLSWTLMHVIDETSPLFGFDDPGRERSDLRILLSVEGRDAAIANEVFDVKDYGRDDIVVGARYVDMVTMHEDGRISTDLALVGAIQLEPTP